MHYWKACALSLTLLPSLSFAQTESIDCKAFAAEQLLEIKREYYGALTRDEAILARDVAERSCRALFNTVEQERAEVQAEAQIQAQKQTSAKKIHWWEQEGKAKPNIKKAQQSGGK